MPFSILILTYNEVKNVAACIHSINSAMPSQSGHDVVVLDSGSSDDTVEVATRLGARVFTRPFDNFSDHRNWAMLSIAWENDWILHLDADERLTRELAEEAEAVLTTTKKHAYLIPNRLIFLGKWVRFSSGYPRVQARLLNRRHARFVSRGHGQYLHPEVTEVGRLRQPYVHYNFSKGIGEWLEKHNKYSTEEAIQNHESSPSPATGYLIWRGTNSQEQRQQLAKKMFSRLAFRPLLRFIYMYIGRLGFLDGGAGLKYCLLLSFYEFMIVLKEDELALHTKIRITGP